MTHPLVTIRATYREVWYDPEDEAGEFPNDIGGFTNPENPWGGFWNEVPEELYGEEFVTWRDANVDTLHLPLWQAAEMVVWFPGGVWDYRDDEMEQNSRTGHYESVTLHIENLEEAVFAIADLIQHLKGQS